MLSPNLRTRYVAGVSYGTDEGAGVRGGIERRWVNDRGHQFFGEAELAALKAAPEILIQVAHPPAWMPGAAAALSSIAAYQIEKTITGAAHSRAGRYIGLEPDWLSTHAARSTAELAGALMATASVPPFMPIGRVNGRPALDGGLGAPNDNQLDNSWALMVFKPGFSAPEWAKGAVIYQIFPDRFRNGRKDNDPKTDDIRYDDPVISLPWGTLPEGYCRNYADATTATCPWRFGDPPAWGVGQKETPRGRDYMGGDLKGVDQKLDYLKSLGVNTLYFNPIFDAGSNHGYDTQDYTKIDPYFGTQKDWENLNRKALAFLRLASIRLMVRRLCKGT